MRTYRNFEEIDRDLKVLRLETKIHKEELKLNVAEIKDYFSAVTTVGNVLGVVAKRAVLFKSLGRLTRFFR